MKKCHHPFLSCLKSDIEPGDPEEENPHGDPQNLDTRHATSSQAVKCLKITFLVFSQIQF